MPEQTRKVQPGHYKRSVTTQEGKNLYVPDDWEVLLPGDAALTRKVKSLGPSWTVQEKKGRKTFSKGVWAPKANIEKAKEAIIAMREDPNYQKKLDQSRARSAAKEVEYKKEFKASVISFLRFHDKHTELAEKFAHAVTEHAVPVGSGTVARTKRISVEERAEAAVIAWMRHQTSAYDKMHIPRVKGMRREVRQKIAVHSRHLLSFYRAGTEFNLESCPLYKALTH